jgi:2-polyprenyl-3-methyl-5-hydroxy-6-metoxy-1,4-benzoquinol methylase
MKDSLWRQPHLIELTYADNFHVVQDYISGRNLKILEVGCGTGFMSLELARMGHDVVGIDPNGKIIRIARRTMETDPYNRTRGPLRYEIADFNKWSDEPETYDIVLFSRVLHDLPHPRKILSRAHHLLKNRGRVICLEYAYDRIDRRAATWLYQIRRALELIGWYSSHLPENPKQGVDSVMKEALYGRKEHINTFQEMRQPLEQLFRKAHFSWHSYYCWDVFRDMRIPDRNREKALASLFRGMEQLLIESGEIRPVSFHFVGTKTSATQAP